MLGKGQLQWQDARLLESVQYCCGVCSNLVGSQEGYCAKDDYDVLAAIYVCPFCHMPTLYSYEHSQVTYPKALVGNELEGVEEEVSRIYEEGRVSLAHGAYTGAVQLCRTLIAHIAVSNGAKRDQTFAAYVNWLSDNAYIPPNSKHVVDYIRIMGNKATHELRIFTREEAERILSFVEMLILFMYRFPQLLPQP